MPYRPMGELLAPRSAAGLIAIGGLLIGLCCGLVAFGEALVGIGGRLICVSRRLVGI